MIELAVTDEEAAAAAGQIVSDLDSAAARRREVDELAARLLAPPMPPEDPEASRQLGDHHSALDELAATITAAGGSSVLTHRSPWSSELIHLKDRIDLSPLWRMPRLHVFGTSDYKWGWTWQISLRLQPTTDLLQDVLEQSETYNVATGHVHADHRLSDHESEVKSFVGFPFVPSVSVGYINVRPYFQYTVEGFVDVQYTGHWPDPSKDEARSYTYGQIYVTSTDANGGDARYEGPVWTRSSFQSAKPGDFHTFLTSGALTVSDGFVQDALVINSRKYVVWVGCYGWAWSKIVPRLATSQVQAVLDATIPFVVVEERPL